MTIGCLSHVEVMFPGCVQPRKGSKLPEDINKLKNFGMYVMDLIGFIRSIPSINPNTHKITDCDYILTMISKYVTSILEETDVHTLVFSIDLCKIRRKEKIATINNRVKQQKRRAEKYGITERIEPPYPDNKYFECGKPLVADMNDMFANTEARTQFYEFLTEFFTSEMFRTMCVPEHKRVIVRGLVGKMDLLSSCGVSVFEMEKMEVQKDDKANHPVEQRYYLPPLFVTKNAIYFDIKLLNLDCPEADLDCYRWLLRYPRVNTIVHSRDGDLLMIGLMQSRLWKMAKKYMGIDRTVIFRTRRSIESKEHSEEKQIEHKRAYDRYVQAIKDGESERTAIAQSGGVTTKTKRKQIVWADRYYDIMALREAIIRCNHFCNEKMEIPPKAPIEEWVLVFCLSSSSHDFMTRSNFVYMVGDKNIFSAYIRKRHEWKEQLVKVECEPFQVFPGNTISGITEASLEEQDGPAAEIMDEAGSASSMPTLTPIEDHAEVLVNKMYYTVNTRVLRQWSTWCYYEAALNRKRKLTKKHNTVELLEKAKLESGKNAEKKHRRSDEQLLCTSGQLAWILQYYGNGPQLRVGIHSGLDQDKEKRSVYGYTAQGYADPENMNKDILKTCPPKPL